MDLCFAGYLTQSSLIAFTTTILNSSPISVIKEDICFIKRSMELSLPGRRERGERWRDIQEKTRKVEGKKRRKERWEEGKKREKGRGVKVNKMDIWEINGAAKTPGMKRRSQNKEGEGTDALRKVT